MSGTCRTKVLHIRNLLEQVSTHEQRRLCVPKHLNKSQKHDVMKPTKCSMSRTDKAVRVLAGHKTERTLARHKTMEANTAVVQDC